MRGQQVFIVSISFGGRFQALDLLEEFVTTCFEFGNPISPIGKLRLSRLKCSFEFGTLVSRGGVLFALGFELLEFPVKLVAPFDLLLAKVLQTRDR